MRSKIIQKFFALFWGSDEGIQSNRGSENRGLVRVVEKTAQKQNFLHRDDLFGWVRHWHTHPTRVGRPRRSDRMLFLPYICVCVLSLFLRSLLPSLFFLTLFPSGPLRDRRDHPGLVRVHPRQRTEIRKKRKVIPLGTKVDSTLNGSFLEV